MDFKHITCEQSEFPNLITSILLKVGLFTSHKSLSRFVRDVLSYDKDNQTKTRYVIEMLRMCVYLIKITTLHYELEPHEVKLLLIYILCQVLYYENTENTECGNKMGNIIIPALLFHKHAKSLGFNKQITNHFKTLKAYEILFTFSTFHDIKEYISKNNLNLSINEHVIREKVYSILRLSDSFYCIKSFPIHSYYFLKRFEIRDINTIPIYCRTIINFLETDILFHLKILEKNSKQIFAIRETIKILNDNIKKWNNLF